MMSFQDDLPFPYRIHIEVTATDQSSIDAINAVGGSVSIVYRHQLNLEAHLHPRRFEILPKTVCIDSSQKRHIAREKRSGRCWQNRAVSDDHADGPIFRLDPT